MILPSLILAVAALQAQDPGTVPATRERIDRLVRDLGSSDETVRAKADRELRTIGRDALPELKKAARSRDAEQAIRARAILIAIRSKDHPSKTEDTTGKPPAHVKRSVTYHDWTNGVFFHHSPDGRVVLRAPVVNERTGRREYKTWRADSPDDFRRKYPEVAKQYDVSHFLAPAKVALEDAEWWADLEEWLGPSGIPGEWPGVWFRGTEHADRHGLDPQRQRPRARRPPGPENREGEGTRLGVHLAPVPTAMRERFGLQENEGLLVRQVEENSRARNSGIKPNDILVKIDGKPAQDVEQVRKDIREALEAGKEFTAEILRGGERKTVSIRPGDKAPTDNP